MGRLYIYLLIYHTNQPFNRSENTPVPWMVCKIDWSPTRISKLFLVHLIGGTWYRIAQLPVYTTYLYTTNMLPIGWLYATDPTSYGNRSETPLTHSEHRGFQAIIPRSGLVSSAVYLATSIGTCELTSGKVGPNTSYKYTRRGPRSLLFPGIYP